MVETKEDGHSQPMVSCILPTFNRERFLPQAIKYFLNQTYENKELVIVDDGSAAGAACIPEDGRIIYIRLKSRTSIGQKFNIGIERSCGQIIQRLDDDDYYDPQFLATTVTELLRFDQKNGIVGLECFLVFLAHKGVVKFSGHGWCADGTMCFFRELWETMPFRDESLAVEWYFKKDHAALEIQIDAPELYMLVRHGDGHTWTEMTFGGSPGAHLNDTNVTKFFDRYPPYPKQLDELLCAEDAAFYRSLSK